MFETDKNAMPIHPLGKNARILLTSVFGPYARDDAYGSRKINPMELYHNQVTRFQGGFSLRMFHRSFGLLMIQENIDAPCTLLDFPDRKRFIQEIKSNHYDVIGISAIMPNVGKAAEMCALIRKYLPGATIVLGGHVANLENIRSLVDADHIVKGDGIRWMRLFLGQDTEAPVKHPAVYSAHGSRIMGVTLPDKPGDTAAILIPSVGCPVGCNFCSTSALFGGKGNFINFFETGDDLFKVMCRLEKDLKAKAFFVLDENFLLHRKRALRLLELIQKNDKSWAIYAFSSARVLKSYRMDQLVGLGLSYVWMGLEGELSQYQKLKNVDTYKLVKKLQANGIRVLGSSIIGLENHTPQNLDAVIDYAVGHNSDFHQFMLYTPIPGTPLYRTHKERGSLYDETRFAAADTHGQFRFNYRHNHIPAGMEEAFLHKAFVRDLQQNGPSLARMIETQLKGWKKHRHHPQSRIRKRFKREAAPLKTTHAGAVWAMAKWYRNNPKIKAKLTILLKDLYQTFGHFTRITAPLIGRYLYVALRREEKRLADGWTYEPPCFYEKNAAAAALEKETLPKTGKETVKTVWKSTEPAPEAAG